MQNHFTKHKNQHIIFIIQHQHARIYGSNDQINAKRTKLKTAKLTII